MHALALTLTALALAAALAVLPSCGDGSTGLPPGDASAPDGSAADAGPTGDASPDAPAGVMCSGTASPTFPTFPKTCGTTADCVIGLHMVNCCGSLAAIGLAASAKPAFDVAEAACESQYPGCGCAAMGIKAEDGQTAGAPDQIGVECRTGACTTFKKP